MGRSWNERGTYGNILKRLIAEQIIQYQRERDKIKKTRISQNIGYLVQVQSGLISSDGKIEERITELERLAGIVKKGVILN